MLVYSNPGHFWTLHAFAWFFRKVWVKTFCSNVIQNVRRPPFKIHIQQIYEVYVLKCSFDQEHYPYSFEYTCEMDVKSHDHWMGPHDTQNCLCEFQMLAVSHGPCHLLLTPRYFLRAAVNSSVGFSKSGVICKRTLENPEGIEVL